MHDRGREIERPLLLLEEADRLRRLCLNRCPCRGIGVGMHNDGADLMRVRRRACETDDELVWSWMCRLYVNAKNTRTRRSLGPECLNPAGVRAQFHVDGAVRDRLERLERREMNRQARRLSGYQRRIFRKQLGLVG